MTDMRLVDRVYFLYSTAYVVENSVTALTLYNQERAISDMTMDVFLTKQRTLRAKN